jgi:hypothetical protein
MQRGWLLLVPLAVAGCGGAPGGGADVDAPLQPDSPRGPGDPAACDPGSQTLHRLNRTEYDRTVKDLLGVAATPVDEFPADDVAAGFDNNAGVLSMSPLLVEKLDDAAQEIAAAVFPDVVAVASVVRVEAEDAGSDTGAAQGDVWNLWSNGSVETTVTTSAGRYAVRVRADQSAAGDDAAHLTIVVDGRDVAGFDVDGLDTYQADVEVSAGAHVVAARFDNDFYAPDEGLDRNLYVDFLEVEGPLSLDGDAPAGVSDGHARFVSCDDDALAADVEGCATSTLRPLLARAFRRPVADDEVAPYVGLVTLAVGEGDSFDAGLRLATEALLLSPSFLFRAEFDDDDAVHRVSTYELASRLSYFLWASMPDAALFARAEDGTLANKSVLKAEVERMLRDPKAAGGVVDALSSQWLNTRGLDRVTPDPTRYPLPDAVRAAMKTETRLVVQALLDADRSAKDVLDVEFTYVDEALADFYGFSDVDFSTDDDGDGFVRVSLDGTHRSGVLTHGAFLTANSYPFRTSPVKRGRWVVDQLLCMPPGDIPPDVPPFNEDAASGSVRQRMEQHRSDPSCAACHAMMDPIGFGLESFDPTGKRRSVDADGYVIDDDDVFFDTAFTDPRGLAAALKQEQTFGPCMAEKIGSYTLGRGLDWGVSGDACTIDDVSVRAEANGFGLRDLLQIIVETDAFQMRHRDDTTGPEEN